MRYHAPTAPMSVLVALLSLRSTLAVRKQLEESKDPEKPTHHWTATEHLGNLANGAGRLVDGVANGAALLKPELAYNCKVAAWHLGVHKTEVDRWVSVSPDFGTSTKVGQWLNLQDWSTWLDQQLGWAQHQAEPFSFDPFVLRSRDAYAGRILVKTVSTPPTDDGEPCVATYEASCPADELQLIKTETCGQGTTTTNVLNFGSFSPVQSFCTKEAVKPSYVHWYGKPSQDVFVLDANGQAQAVKLGNCVKVSTVDPTTGIDLEDLDGDMMGMGLQKLAANATKLEHVLSQLNQTLVGIAHGIAATAGTVIEAGSDVVDVGKKIDKDLLNGTKAAGNTSVKWIKKLTLDSLVDTCLCCTAEAYGTEESLSEHCKVAYTLGGTNKSQWLKYSAKASVGTVYNLAQTAGGWLVPFLGGNIVRESHKKACRYACSLRKPHLYESYGFGKVRKVPGMAMKTWFIPNPASFYSSAAAGLGEEVGEAVVEGAASNAANGVVTGVLDF